MAGLQCLTLLLAVSLILATGALIGSIAITTWEDLLETSEQTGEESVAMCLVNGEGDVTLVGGRYLKSVVVSVKESMENIFDTPETAIHSLRYFAEAQHPNKSTDPQYIDTSIRRVMRAVFESSSHNGVTNMVYNAFPISPAYPHPFPHQATQPVAPWGGQIVMFTADPVVGILPTNGSVVKLTMSSINPATLQMAHSNLSVAGEMDGEGFLADKTAHPYGLDCGIPVDYNKGKLMRRCLVPGAMITSPGMMHANKLMFENMVDDTSELKEADTTQYLPVSSMLGLIILQATYVFTHPEQINMHPRQGKRVAQVSAAFRSDGLARMLTQQDLPEGSLLYAVEHNTWTNTVGTLVAYNKGRVLDLVEVMAGPPINALMNQSILMHCSDHTEVQGSGVPSLVAGHCRYTFGAGGFQAMADRTEHEFHSWVVEGQEFWTITSVFARGTTLKWYLNLLVPRAAIMDQIDAGRAQIVGKTEENKRDAKDKKQRGVIVMLAATTAAVSALLMLSVFFTRKIISPLHHLGQDMANVATMNLEAVDLHCNVSKLSEVASMQASFHQMVSNLIEYRHYMPQSVLMPEKKDEEENESDSIVDRDVRSHQTSSGELVSAHGSSAKLAGGARFEGGMKRRNVSMTYMNIKSFHEFCKPRSDTAVLNAHSSLVSIIMQSVVNHNGVCDVFSGDRVLGTFNAYSQLGSHRASCIKASVEVCKRVEPEGVKVSFGCGSGEARIGHMGCAGMKKVTILSTTFPWVTALERFNRRNEYSGLADQFMAREVAVHFVLKCVDAVVFNKRCTKGPIQVFEIVGENRVQEAEWMYQMEAAQKSPYSAWNDVFGEVLKQKWEEAARIFAQIEPGFDSVCFYSKLK